MNYEKKYRKYKQKYLYLAANTRGGSNGIAIPEPIQADVGRKDPEAEFEQADIEKKRKELEQRRAELAQKKEKITEQRQKEQEEEKKRQKYYESFNSITEALDKYVVEIQCCLKDLNDTLSKLDITKPENRKKMDYLYTVIQNHKAMVENILKYLADNKIVIKQINNNVPFEQYPALFNKVYSPLIIFISQEYYNFLLKIKNKFIISGIPNYLLEYHRSDVLAQGCEKNIFTVDCCIPGKQVNCHYLAYSNKFHKIDDFMKDINKVDDKNKFTVETDIKLKKLTDQIDDVNHEININTVLIKLSYLYEYFQKDTKVSNALKEKLGTDIIRVIPTTPTKKQQAKIFDQ